MKRKSITIGIAFFAIILLASLFPADAEDNNNDGNYVKVIYFHGNRRCHTCVTIEEYIKEAVNGYFEEEMKSGKVKWAAINYDEEKNEHYLKDFNMFNQTLILIKYKNGKQTEWKDCEKIWELVRDRDKFLDYVKKEVKDYLKGV